VPERKLSFSATESATFKDFSENKIKIRIAALT
jgi:hypothetical protein